MIYFITGGQRSGKSRFGQELAKRMGNKPIYLATSRIWDEDHHARIKRHQEDRDDSWHTIEEEKKISQYDFKGKVVLLDCLTLWLTNFFTDNDGDVELTLQQTKAEINSLISQDLNLIIISNEIGMGLHAETSLGRKFTDLQGWINQHVAELANEVYFMMSGISMRIK
ncbi:bifunctional adenosylcobinamide kinase/adenosylcobinamide-phosphate guanylyltransferase [Flexithrix dorotheae]|uniref:bifunctional adenosylcobinamide kinase/adenosylcobinamide-phosphate guanylyltransferase n=1 Tax=Flexithrix dorotheae TaxID=70993 RepID=UPI0003723EC1|nr:bifunctional adenosylcobinamide kinase/adenosylcobinamide-phosphate guanylyltransferase [Flexithrix dorotheae]